MTAWWWVALCLAILVPWVLAAPGSVYRAGVIAIWVISLGLAGVAATAHMIGRTPAEVWVAVPLALLVSGCGLLCAAEASHQWHDKQRAMRGERKA